MYRHTTNEMAIPAEFQVPLSLGLHLWNCSVEQGLRLLRGDRIRERCVPSLTLTSSIHRFTSGVFARLFQPCLQTSSAHVAPRLDFAFSNHEDLIFGARAFPSGDRIIAGLGDRLGSIIQCHISIYMSGNLSSNQGISCPGNIPYHNGEPRIH